tara:strand:- start:433 stop:723 length:291 start_codon:yes stop_codon:yes gene_type:complete
MAITTIIDVKNGLTNKFATEDDKYVYQTHQNVQPVLDAVKNYSQLEPGKEFRHVAEIPMVIYNKMLREGSIKDKSHLKRWLNDPDNKMFRVWKGKI